mgnify:CR=1 FL=1
MNLLIKLFVLATFLGSLSAIDREPIESPDWFNNPPQEYVAATGSTIEKAFLRVIYNYSQQKGFDHYMEKMLLSKIKQDKESLIVSCKDAADDQRIHQIRQKSS